MKSTKPFNLKDFSRGTIRTVSYPIAPQNSFKLGLNLDSDQELGSLMSRNGTALIGTQAVASATCKGLHYHRDTVASNHFLFGVYGDGVNNDIYNMLTGAKSLEDDTLGLKTRFATFMGSTVRVNGTDAAKSFNGSAWVTTGGAFDEANMPRGSVVIEWLDRLYTAGVAASPTTLYYSSIADPDSRTVNWTDDGTDSGSGNLPIEQEDGGGVITALEKIPGYLLIFKERSMKRWDGQSTYPDDLISVGAPSQEAVCRGRGMVFIANNEGLWATNGSYPKKISKPIQDLWDAATISNVATYCDENYVYVYVGDITLGDNSYSNVLFRYSIDSQTFDVFSYYNNLSVFTWYSSDKVMIGGDDNGQVIQLNTGNTDYHSTVQPITYSLETQDIDLGTGRLKEINQLIALTRNIRTGQILYRANYERDKDWKSIRNITNDVEEINDFSAKGNWFNLKITGITNSGQVKIIGLELPAGINITENVTD